MTIDMGAAIAQAMREEGAELQRRMERLLVQPPAAKVFIFPFGEVEVQLDPTMPKNEIHLRQYGVMVGRIVNLKVGE